MTDASYRNLFSPFRLGDLSIRNRLVMAPMSTGLASLTGSVTPQQIAYYRARAAGGVGLLIVEFTCVQRKSGISERHQLSLETIENLDGHCQLVAAIRREGAVPCLQLQHGGMAAKQHLIEGGVPCGPSDVLSKRGGDKLAARAMSGAEIESIVECFGRTAELGVLAGYEAFELHGAHGYLLSSFLSPLTNHRDDAWGGDEERRTRFPATAIARVKQAIGNRPLIYRVSADEFAPGGICIEDMERIAPRLVAAGADAIHVSTGNGWHSMDKVIEPMSAPEGWRLPYARRVKAAAGVAVIAVGQIRWPETAEDAIARGDADLIALGRPLLADPEWGNKARRGDREEIRPCTSCNYCHGLGLAGLGIGCAENPLTGRELDVPFDAGARRGARAVVVGAGPGGLAAALMLDAAGYHTELYESRALVGGGLIASAAPPFKDKLNWYLDFLRRRLARSGVRTLLESRPNLATLQDPRPEIIIVAAGGRPVQLLIEGLDGDIVFDAYEMLMGNDSWKPQPGSDPVLVYGGGEAGVETAEYVADQGLPVLLVTRSPAAKLARSAELIYRKALRVRIAANQRIQVVDNTTVTRIAGKVVTLKSTDGTATQVRASRVLIAQGREPDRALAQRLAAAGLPYAVIGDNRHGGRIGDAVLDAYETVKALCAAQRPLRELNC